MEAQKESDCGGRKKSWAWIKWGVLVAAILVLLLFALIPAFVSSGMGRRLILARTNKSIAGRVDFAGLSMSWWKGIRVRKFSFNDDNAGVAVSIRQIDTKPHYASLLLGNFSFGTTVMDEPRVEIDLTRKPAAEPAVQPAPSVSPQPFVLPIDRIGLKVNNGSVKLCDVEGRPVEFTRISTNLNLRPPGEPTDFDVSLNVLNGDKEGAIRTDGHLAPTGKGWSLKGTSGEFTVEVNDLNLSTVTPLWGLGGLELQANGVVSANIKSELDDGRVAKLSGSIVGSRMDFTGGPLQHDHISTDRLNVEVSLRTEKELVNVEKLVIHSDWLQTELTGIVPTTFDSLSQLAESGSPHGLNGSFECDLATAFSQMPHTLRLKEGMQVTSGKVNGMVETVVAEGTKKIRANANLTGLAGTVAERQIALSEPVSAEIVAAGEKAGLKFDKLAVSAPFARISCSGTKELLKYDASVNLSKLQSELGQFISVGKCEIAGQFFSAGQISSTEDKVGAAGKASLKELRLSTADGLAAVEPLADMSFSVAVKPDEKLVEVGEAEVKANLGRFSVKDSAVAWAKEGPMKLNVSAGDIDLAKLQPFAVILASLPRELLVGGTVASQFSLIRQKGGYEFSTEATHVKDLQLTSSGRPPFEQPQVSLVTDVEVNPSEKTFAVKRLELISPQIKIRKAEISQVTETGKSRLNGQLDCEYNWSAVTAAAAPFLPQGLQLEGSRKDTITFASEYPAEEPNKLVANLTAKAKLGFESAGYMGLNFGPTATVLEVQKGLLTLAPFSTTVNEGQFNFGCGADFKKEPTLLETPSPMQIAKDVQINNEMAAMLLKYLNPIFADAVNVTGLASFDCERLAIPLGGAPKKSLQVIGTISVDELRLSASELLSTLLSVGGVALGEQKLRLHPTRFMLWDGYLRYDDMQIDVGDNPFNFKGVTGLDGSLNMTAALPYTLDGRTIRVGQEDAPDRIIVPLKGTISKPEVDVGKLLESQLRQRLEDEVQKGLERLLK